MLNSEEKEVWLQAYCAAVSSGRYEVEVEHHYASSAALNALEAYKRQFYPASVKEVSNETVG